MAAFNRMWPVQKKEKKKDYSKALEYIRKLREVDAWQSAKSKLDARRSET